jgi:DNA-binding transcriptional LysR family regulator
MTLEQLTVFVKVIDAGGFTRAAELLDMQRSNVSRVIAQLEAELRVVLLERTTRTQSITEAGQAVYERAVGILAAVEDTVRVTQHIQDEPRGRLRISCGVEFGMVAMGTLIEQYLAHYPNVTVDAEYTSREFDLVHEGFDLAIRAGPLADSSLVTRALGKLDYGLFASRYYLNGRGKPETPEDLGGHSLVVFTGGNARSGLTLTHDDRREPLKVTAAPRLRVNVGTGVLSALLHGLGIGQLPTVVAAGLVAQGKLVPVLPTWRPPSVPVHAVYPSNRYLTPKVRAFVDLAIERFPWSELDKDRHRPATRPNRSRKRR